MDSLAASVGEKSADQLFDLVILTGDLANAGTVDDYRRFEEILLNPLRQLTPLARAQFLAVPGNHDLNCDETLPSPWATLGAARQEVFFDSTDRGRAVREPRARGFSAFSDFAARQKLIGLDPRRDAAVTVNLESKNGISASFLCVNSAFFSDKDTTDKNAAPAPTQAIRSDLSQIDEGRFRFVVGHHPIGWFHHPTQEALKTLLLQESAVYLHGHSHKISVETTLKGLRSIGFGAAYQAPLDAPSPSFYENSYAVCVLDDEGYLNVEFYTWDSQHGRWCLETHLPAEFTEPSPILTHGHRLELPRKTPRRRSRQEPSAVPAPRPPVIETLVSPEIPSIETWTMLLKSLGIVPRDVEVCPLNGESHPGQAEFTYDDLKGLHRVRCIGGPGHMLSAREVEAENTRFDTESYESVVVASLGEVADDARTLALQLERKKQMQIVDNREICKNVADLLSGPISEHLEALDSVEVSASFLLLPGGVGLLVRDRLKDDWFYLLNHVGQSLTESEPVVRRIRESIPELAIALYRQQGVEEGATGAVPRTDFDREAYLARCREEFETLKYAPLAAIGIRFPYAKLPDVYVPASADVGGPAAESAAQRQAVNDLLDSLQLDDAQRTRLEIQLRDGLGVPSLGESGATRGLYQQRGAVLILGDPGSGKTCFAKNEILSYCDPPSTGGSWYSLHTPVYVPLAEAATLLNSDRDIHTVAIVLASRRSLPLTGPQLRSLLAKGRVAFFFDGLDEVASIEQRGRLVEAIGQLVSDMAPLGNRFVLTSRPAAVELLDVPAGLTPLRLKGLTDEEMRRLVGNLLRAEIAPGADSIRLSDRELSSTDQALIDQLLEDCRSNPGIRRIARNPLLLTLLVMIYANSGSLAAKRHRVYAQAIQTLVSVRNRESGQPVFSEADLRHRLGYAALELYQSNIPDIPSRDRVAQLIETALRREGRTGDLRGEAESFIQSVAEATGLLILHRRPGPTDGARISFLHHSFLEYYAALGFLETSDTTRALPLSSHGRWREVITLMAGIIGDRGDVTPFIAEMLQPLTPADRITGDRLLFAFDCALECDVPPEQTQELLMEETDSIMRNGPGLIDPGLRRELGDRMGRLLMASGSQYVRTTLAVGIAEEQPELAAAFIELAGVVGRSSPMGEEIRESFEAACGRRDTAVRIAVFGAMERTPEFRNQPGFDALREGLRASAPVKYAAARAVEAAPAIAKSIWDDVIRCLDDKQSVVGSMIARAVLRGGFALELADRQNVLEKCLRLWERTAAAGDPGDIRIQANRRDLDDGLSSPDRGARMLALRLLPWLNKEEAFVHERLTEVIRGDRERTEQVAALASLRLCRGAVALLTTDEISLIRSLLDSPNRDVRVGAIRVLGALPPDSANIQTLLARARTADHAELREVLGVLIEQGSANPDVREFLFGEVEQHLHSILNGRIGNEERQQETRRLLTACQDIGGDGPPRIVSQLFRAAKNYKVPRTLRQHSLRAYARLVRPSSEAASRFVGLLSGSDPILGVVLGQAVAEFVKRCRQKLDYVREVFPVLPALEDALVTRWTCKSPTPQSFQVRSGSLRGIRGALKETRELLVGYAEFGTYDESRREQLSVVESGQTEQRTD